MEGLKPLFIVKPKTMSRHDITRAEKHAGICVVECSDPDSVRFLDAPQDAGMDVQARAAISLMRMVVSSKSAEFKRGELTKWFVEQILNFKALPQSVPPVRNVPQPKETK